jgi:uncharacterized protein
MLRSSSIALILTGATVACGAGAAPRAPHAPASADDVLVDGPVETDADIARAIREHYTKYEYKVPMRDGAKLFTVAYVPKDASKTWPILMMRTPYSVAPYGADVYPDAKSGRTLRRFAPSPQLVKEGYIFVHQDVRGRMASEGTFVDIRPLVSHADKKAIDESTDTWDTIDWLVKNVPQNSGNVGVWGISYPGFYAAQSAVDAHPALKAVSPQAPVTEWFLGDDFHHNGALFLADAFHFYSGFGRARPEPIKKSPPWESEQEGRDVYDFFLALGPISNANARYFKGAIPFWNDLMEHDTRDAFWKARDPRPFYRETKPAVMTVGGFLDAEDAFGALETYRTFEKQSPRNENVLVMGPWRHGGWARTDGDRHGDISFGQKTSSFYREKIEKPFFQRHLKGKKLPPAREAWIFETGTNTWNAYPSWPPPDAKPATFYFRDNGKLGSTPSAAGEDVWISDPRKPVPYRARSSEAIDAEYMSDDQRFAARRPDVVVYQTDELDSDVRLAGPIEASLWVATTGTDADFVVKLVDVWPPDAPDPDPNPTNVRMAGYQQLVRGEVMRGKFRKSFEHPEPFTPNEATLVKFSLPDTCHTFRTGHRIMVHVQSSWFPLVDRNPQTFVSIPKATEADFKIATHRILRAPDKPSGIKVTVQRGRIP